MVAEFVSFGSCICSNKRQGPTVRKHIFLNRGRTASSAINLAIESVMKGSKIVLVGLQGGRIPLPLPTLPFKALSLVGNYMGSLGELEERIEIAKGSALRLTPIWKHDMQCLCDSLDRCVRRRSSAALCFAELKHLVLRWSRSRTTVISCRISRGSDTRGRRHC